MARTTYTIDFTDSTVDPVSKAPFQIGPGDYDGPDQVDPSKSHTSINLFGQGYLRYGEKANENFLRMLENFASSHAPVNPTVGQLWYDTGTSSLKVCQSVDSVGVGTWGTILVDNK